LRTDPQDEVVDTTDRNRQHLSQNRLGRILVIDGNIIDRLGDVGSHIEI
jgi:hypothetical protein